MAKDVTPLKIPPRGGRPRGLILNDVLAAAAEIGLDALSMTAVAAKLGVGVATLYTYVDGVEELRRLVAARAARRPLIEEAGQHWSMVVAAHTRAVYAIFANEPSLIAQYAEGGLGAEGLLDEVERFLELMAARGFDMPLAIRVYRMAGCVALGAAAAVCNTRGLEARGLSPERALRRDFAGRDPAGLPVLGEWLDAYLERGGERLIDDGVALLVRSVAALRGEDLPDEDI